MIQHDFAGGGTANPNKRSRRPRVRASIQRRVSARDAQKAWLDCERRSWGPGSHR